MRTEDRTVFKNLGLSGFGNGSNMAKVDVKDGRIARIRPVHYDERYTRDDLNAWQIKARGKVFDPGFKSLLPPFSLAYKKRAYSPNRIPYPLKRIDWDPQGERNTHQRGTSTYERISWDEAAGLIAAEIERMHREYGPEAILAQGEGHGESKSVAGGHGCQTMLLDHIGGYTLQARQPDSWEGWYWGAKHVWGMDPVGQNTSQNNIIKDVSEHSDAVLYWGADPETTPWGWSGQQASRLCYWFNELAILSIFICPDVNYANGIHADKWIPVLPNTDAALQLALAYVWITEDSYDRGYIDSHTIGFDWLESYVLGYIDAVPKTPAWAQEKCGVPSYRIKALARYWAAHAVSIAHGNGGGYIRGAFAHEPARLEVCLLAMQGLGKPGANQFKFIEWNLFGMETNNPLPPSEVIPNTIGGWHGWMMAPPKEPFVPKTLVPNTILEGKVSWYGRVCACLPRVDQFTPYSFPPEGSSGLHMIWTDTPCWETCWNGGHYYQEALRSETIECIVVQHPWLENDCLFADIILPVATQFEVEDFACDVFSGQWNGIYLEERAIDPIGEAKSDYRCVAEVAKKLEQYGGKYQDLYEKYTKGRSEDEDIRLAYEHCGIDPEQHPFEDFLEHKFHLFPTREGWEGDPVGMSRFYEDPERHPVETPTGKLEIYSVPIKEAWPEDTVRAPYPQWIEETDAHQERISSERAGKYPYLLVSNHPRWRVHAECDDITWLREIPTCKVVGPDGYGYEPVWLHPTDAARHRIAEGDIVKIFNERGAVLGGAIITERIMPGALYQDHGARVDSIVFGYGTGLDRGGANNLICPNATTSENAPGEVTNGFLVGVEKVDVLVLAQQYPEAFNRKFDPAAGLVARARIIEEA
ncbi:MAG: molybdopterin-dependent oxidoreductase [Coriobacteriales bacterium]|jgi:trimethylamine-N-oxide reductase (cytochrome c)|nr:molybdopterin-dependent oxidoreductase [Coriobacteriales bacterium]